MRTETIQVNSIIFRVGRKYLYKITNSGTTKEKIEKKKIVEKLGYKDLLSIINDREMLLDTEIWYTMARIYDNECYL